MFLLSVASWVPIRAVFLAVLIKHFSQRIPQWSAYIHFYLFSSRRRRKKMSLVTYIVDIYLLWEATNLSNGEVFLSQISSPIWDQVHYIFQADCCCGCCCGRLPDCPIPVDKDGKAGIWGRPARAAVEPIEGAMSGDIVAPASLGNRSLRFFSRCASHLCTESSLRSTCAKDWSRKASGRHCRRASRALGCSESLR